MNFFHHLVTNFNMDRSDYKLLGQFIEPVMEKNSDLSVKLSQGINNQKYFQNPRQVAENSANDQIVRTGQFAFNKATTRNGDKISIAYREGPDCTVSSAYQVFRIKDEDQLNPHYLMLWFKRPEFDRYARFKSHGSAHEFFDWEEMCNVTLPVPSITEQRRIVNEYQTVERRIKNNEALIQKLEETAQAIYHHTFVENIDENNLPDGWKNISIKDFCKETKSGGTPDRGRKEYWDKDDYRWLKSGEVQNNVVLDVEEWISEEGLNNSSAKVIPAGSVIMAMYGATAAQVAYLNCDATTNQACCNMLCKSHDEAAYLYFALKAKQNTIKVLANGGAQENLSQELIVSQSIIQPKNCEPLKPFAVLLDNIVSVSRELHHRRTLQSLVTSKLA